MLVVAGYNPKSRGVWGIISWDFSKPKYISNVIIKATPITLTALSVAFAYKVGMFNIGAEGQYIVAAVASTIVGYLFNLPAILQVPLVVMTAWLQGALYGGIVGF